MMMMMMMMMMITNSNINNDLGGRHTRKARRTCDQHVQLEKKNKSRVKKLSLLLERMAGQEKVLCWRCLRASDDWNETRVCT